MSHWRVSKGSFTENNDVPRSIFTSLTKQRTHDVTWNVLDAKTKGVIESLSPRDIWMVVIF